LASVRPFEGTILLSVRANERPDGSASAAFAASRSCADCCGSSGGFFFAVKLERVLAACDLHVHHLLARLGERESHQAWLTEAGRGEFQFRALPELAKTRDSILCHATGPYFAWAEYVWQCLPGVGDEPRVAEYSALPTTPSADAAQYTCARGRCCGAEDGRR